MDLRRGGGSRWGQDRGRNENTNQVPTNCQALHYMLGIYTGKILAFLEFRFLVEVERQMKICSLLDGNSAVNENKQGWEGFAILFLFITMFLKVYLLI